MPTDKFMDLETETLKQAITVPYSKYRLKFCLDCTAVRYSLTGFLKAGLSGITDVRCKQTTEMGMGPYRYAVTETTVVTSTKFENVQIQ